MPRPYTPRESAIVARGRALRRLTDSAEDGRRARAAKIVVVDAAERPLSWEGFGGSVSGAVLLATVESAGGSTRPDGSPITTYATSIRVRDWDSRVMATACTCEDHEHHVTEGDAAHVIGDTPGGFGSYVWACKHVVAVADRYREVRRAELKAR